MMVLTLRHPCSRIQPTRCDFAYFLGDICVFAGQACGIVLFDDASHLLYLIMGDPSFSCEFSCWEYAPPSCLFHIGQDCLWPSVFTV